MKSDKKYFNRDLSWLSFNYRVLMEAADQSVPLYSRIKFIAIYSSNLDEFFRVRVATWRRISHLKRKKFRTDMGLSPKKILKRILKEVNRQQKEYGKIFKNQIIKELRQNDIILYQSHKLLKSHEAAVRRYFLSRVLAYLQPVVLTGSREDTPFLENGRLYFIIKIQRSSRQEPEFVHLNIPSEHLPRFHNLPQVRSRHYIIYLDDIIRWNLPYVFQDSKILGCYSIKMNRDADVEIQDEYSGDLIAKIRDQIEKRKVGVPTRFLYDQSMPADVLNFLREYYQLSDEDLVIGGRYHNMHDFMKFPNPLAPKLEEQQLPPLINRKLEGQASLLNAVSKKDVLLQFPYESYDLVLRFFNEAAIDPEVEAIKVTLYRVASDSKIARALVSAARNGKSVTVFVEIKARFDEANNLKWAEKMKEAGVKLIYSIPGLKVHAKIALVRRNTASGTELLACYGTGNFHEGTASVYSDFQLLTGNQSLNQELEEVFKFLDKQPYSDSFSHLLVAQHNMQSSFLELIDREIRNHQKGFPSGIVIKLNNIEDTVMIDKLYQAGQAGVKVTMLVRSICCLVPGKSFSPNIKVIRLVDRYLEHARVFWFKNEGADDVFLASADWMNRNLYRRIEVGFPVYDPAIKKSILTALKLQMADNTKAYQIDSRLNHQPNNRKQTRVRAQSEIYKRLRAKVKD